jgi:hypothetical protein
MKVNENADRRLRMKAKIGRNFRQNAQLTARKWQLGRCEKRQHRQIMAK